MSIDYKELEKFLLAELVRLDDALAEIDDGNFQPGDEGWGKGEAYNEKEVAHRNHINTREMREDVFSALERIKNGTYGLCVKCNVKIDEDRLLARPYVSKCVKCQAKTGVKFHNEGVKVLPFKFPKPKKTKTINGNIVI